MVKHRLLMYKNVNFIFEILRSEITFFIGPVYFPSAYYSVYGVNSYNSLNKNDFLYLKVADLVIYLA